MDLAGVQRLTCSLPAVSLLHSLTHNSKPNHAAIIFSSKGLVRPGPAQVQRVSDGTLTQTVHEPASTKSPERAEACVHLDRAGVCMSAPGAVPGPSPPPIGEKFSET
jgi:hypothetical protein